MIDSNKSFDVDSGLGPGGPDNPKLFSGAGVPNFIAPIGSVCFDTDGTKYKFVGPSANDWISMGSSLIGALGYSWTDGKSFPYLFTDSNNYTTVSKFVWPGSDMFGDLSQIYLNKAVKNAVKDCAVRVYDVTNNQVIAEITSFNNTDFMPSDMGAILNTPTSGVAAWEVQAKRNVSGGEARISTILLVN